MATKTTGMTEQEYKARIAELEAALAAKNSRTPFLYVSEDKGTVCVGGINAIHPVPLYAGQWPKLIEFLTGQPLSADAPISKFIASNASLLPTKDDTQEVTNQKASLRKADKTGVVRHPKNNVSA